MIAMSVNADLHAAVRDHAPVDSRRNIAARPDNFVVTAANCAAV